jgi:hypothetical protein
MCVDLVKDPKFSSGRRTIVLPGRKDLLAAILAFYRVVIYFSRFAFSCPQRSVRAKKVLDDVQSQTAAQRPYRTNSASGECAMITSPGRFQATS